MDQYLYQILQSQNTIIIPGLGALTITNEKTGEIMFMPYLKYDDGQLVKHIAEKENWTEFEVKNLIAKYVRDIEIKLDKGETYDMFNFGRFLKNNDGEVEFQNWGSIENTAPTSESSTATLVETESIEMATPETVESETPIEAEEIPSHVPEIETEQRAENLVQALVEDEIIEAEIEAVRVENNYTPPSSAVEPETEETIQASEKIIVADQRIPASKTQAENSFTPKETAGTPTEKTPRKKRSVGFIAGTTIAVIGILIAISSIFFYDQLKSVFPFLLTAEKNVKDATTYDTLKDQSEDFENAEAKRIEADRANSHLENDTLPNVETVSTPTPDATPAKTSTTTSTSSTTTTTVTVTEGNYHLIIGGFSEESNAQRFAEKSQATVLGKINGLYLVSANSFATTNEANAALKSNGKGWILKR